MIILFIICLLHADDSLVSVEILARHGDRGPLMTISNLNFSYPSGELTPLGLSQHKNLGGFIRDHYRDFLPDNYDTKNIYLRASAVPRCLLSLWALTSGIYPDGVPEDEILAWPIRTEDNDPVVIDFMLRSYGICPTVSALKNEYVNSESFKKKLNDMQNVFSELSKILNILVDKNNWDNVLDALICQNAHGGLNPDYRHFIDDLFPLRYSYYNNYPRVNFDVYRKAAMSIALNEFFFTNLDADLSDTPSDTNGGTKKLLRLYLAHDSTLLALFSTFNMTIDFFPYYAAAVIIELWKEERTEEAYLRFYYQRDEVSARKGQLWGDDNEITKVIPGCAGGNGKCYRNGLLDYWKDIVVTESDSTDFRNVRCNAHDVNYPPVIRTSLTLNSAVDDDKKLYTFHVLISVFAVFSFATTLINLVIIVALCKRSRQGGVYTPL